MIINLNSKIAGTCSSRPLTPQLEAFIKTYTLQRQLRFSSVITDQWNALDKIDNRLYLGGELAASNREILQRNNITHIVNAAIDSRLYDHQGIRIIKCQIDDSAIAPDGYFESMANLLNSMVQDTHDIDNILVHCVAGISRSATIILSYLILHKKLSFYKALKYIEECRSIVSPHPLLVYSMLRDFGDKIDLS